VYLPRSVHSIYLWHVHNFLKALSGNRHQTLLVGLSSSQ
jgi:hypothetical protein